MRQGTGSAGKGTLTLNSHGRKGGRWGQPGCQLWRELAAMLRASRLLGGNGVCGEDDMAEQPNTEPDKQLSLASRNRISITVTGSGWREGEPGEQRGSALPAHLLSPCQAGTLSTQGCPLGWVPPLPPWVCWGGELCWVPGEPRAGTGPGRGGGLAPMPWAPQGGTEWVLPIGGGSVAGDPDAGLGGGVDLGTASTGRGDMAPHGSSAQVRNSSRHAIYHRRRSGKLLYKRISSAGRAGEAGLHGPWAARRG